MTMGGQAIRPCMRGHREQGTPMGMSGNFSQFPQFITTLRTDQARGDKKFPMINLLPAIKLTKKRRFPILLFITLRDPFKTVKSRKIAQRNMNSAFWH